MRLIIATLASLLAWSIAAFADEVKQNTVNAAGAPAKTDAEPGYWTNLFENTMRFTIMHPAGKQVVDIFFNRDKTVTTNAGLAGAWTTQGEPGKEIFCHEFGAFKSVPAKVSECFPLRLMNNPCIGAKWGGKMKPDINYLAEVVAGRPNALKTLAN
ncbi:MAG: hypothetical protein EXR11_00235 [Rhodospirillaceae bacterium]|nr:hypothetical protein [Rhodospirillaceae bacterium]